MGIVCRVCAFCQTPFLISHPDQVCCAPTCPGLGDRLLALVCEYRADGQPSEGQPAERRIWGRAVVDAHRGCWNYTGHPNKAGYGTLTYEGRSVLAHRLGWGLLFGFLPPELCVCHRCDNPACVNPAHWFPGTHKNNRDDAVRKGRARNPRMPGSQNPASVLTEQDVIEARRIHAAGEMNISALARRYGIGREGMRDMLHGKTWGWL